MKVVLREQHATERTVRHLGIWFLGPLLVLLLVVFIFARSWRGTLVIETVSVEGAKALAAKDVVSMAAIQPLAFLAKADLFDARKRLLDQPYIKSAVVMRCLPHTLKIEIVEREPIASLQGSELRYVDSEAVLIPRFAADTQFDVPVISGIAGLDSAAYGVPVHDTDLVAALEVIKAGQLSGFYHAISEVHVAPGADIVMYSAEGGVPVFLGRGEMGKKLVTLQTFWSAYMKPDTLAQLQYIDARFDGQIVVKRTPPRTPVVRRASL